jgi:hypothetical protein
MYIDKSTMKGVRKIDENKDGTVVKSYFAKHNIFTGKVA